MKPPRAILRSLLLTVLVALAAGKFRLADSSTPDALKPSARHPATKPAWPLQIQPLMVALPRLPPAKVADDGAPAYTLPSFAKTKSPAEIVTDAKMSAERTGGVNLPVALKMPANTLLPSQPQPLIPAKTLDDPATDLGEVLFADGIPLPLTLDNGQTVIFTATAQDDTRLSLRLTSQQALPIDWSKLSNPVWGEGQKDDGVWGDSSDVKSDGSGNFGRSVGVIIVPYENVITVQPGKSIVIDDFGGDQAHA